MSPPVALRRSSGRLARAGALAVLCCALSAALAPPARAAFVYPLKVSANGRFLVDQNGVPFLLAGDGAQGLLGNISVADADTYFANRASHGFNASWVSLLVNTYTGGRADGTTFDGIAPFTTPGNLATPNEAYFARADQVIQEAANHGIIVLLDPIETGGWLTVLRNNGATAARAYGRYLGGRYAHFDNIIWLNGNDFQTWRNTDDDTIVKAVALGIRDLDTRHMHTIELDYYTSDSVEDPTWQSFVGLNSAYTYYSIYAQLYADYNLSPAIPSILIESNYEESTLGIAPRTPSAHDMRAQYYWADLSGATGQVYGSQEVNAFAPDWQSHLSDPGGTENLYLQNLLLPRSWYLLIPDQTHVVVTAGYGTFSNAQVSNQGDTYAPTARIPDGSLVLTYMPTARAITVNMTQMAGATTARWYDPTTGTYTAITGSPFQNTGSRAFTPPSTTHADGSTDWVLVLEAATHAVPALGATPAWPLGLVFLLAGVGAGLLLRPARRI